MKTLFVLALFATAASAAPIRPVKTWVNPACASGSCDLKGMKLFLKKDLSPTTGGTSMTAEIETTNPEAIGKYAFVQYIRGCSYDRREDGEKRFTIREFFGNDGHRFIHRDWEIDSAPDADPIYWSYPGSGWDPLRGRDIPRNYGYAFGNEMADEYSSTWAGRVQNLRSNRVYAADAPTMTSIQKKGAKWSGIVSSLEFRICLHEIAKVPAEAQTPGTIIPEPITCMEWASNYGYDEARGRVIEKTELDPFCR